MPSNSQLFAKRGDPWISRKEAIRDFEREPDYENPDYDFDNRFHHAGNVIGKPTVALAREEHKEQPGKPIEADLRRKLANIRQRHRNNSRPIKVKDNEASAVIHKVYCPFHCGFGSHESRTVREHVRERVSCKCGFKACNPQTLERHKRDFHGK